MSDSTIASPPKVDAECPHTHKHLVVESLTVKRPDGKASVAIASYPGATGVWVQSGNGMECVGLVVQEGVGPYLAIYDEKAHGVPTAISQYSIQVHADKVDAVTTIPLADLVAAIRHIKDQP